MEMRQARHIRRMLGMVIVAAATAALGCSGALAQGRDPLVLLNLPRGTEAQGLGSWLQDALRDEPVRVRTGTLDALGLDGQTAAVITWTDPRGGGADTKRLRSYLRSGGGLIYVIGEGRQHITRARALLGPLNLTVTQLDGGAGSSRWVDHPLTEGLQDPGAVTPGSAISGPGASPLIRSGNRDIAVAIDWGEFGRAVVLDHSVLFDQVYEAGPRPSVRPFLLRAALWAAGVEPGEPVKRREFDDEPPQMGPVGGLVSNTAVLDLPADEKDNWGEIRRVLLDGLQQAGLSVTEPRLREGEPLLDADTLASAGMLVIGSGRDSEQVDWVEPLAVGWFFDHGGRILAIPRAAGGTLTRMVGFNELLTQLRIAVSLERDNGQAQIVPHPITRGITTPDNGLRVREGAQVWAPLTEPLVMVRDRPAAVAWQRDQGRIVVIDGELLRAQRGQQRPYPQMLELLRNSLDWLRGD